MIRISASELRFGLDVVRELQDMNGINVTIEPTTFPDIKATDDKLVALCKKISGLLYTTDYNLSKVAAVETIRCLKLNELAQFLRPVALPGETVMVKIVQRGSSPNQGVGYLDDGTMIVVDGAAKLSGRKVTATVERMIKRLPVKWSSLRLIIKNRLVLGSRRCSR